jgi:hypothetical protein
MGVFAACMVGLIVEELGPTIVTTGRVLGQGRARCDVTNVERGLSREPIGLFKMRLKSYVDWSS